MRDTTIDQLLDEFLRKSPRPWLHGALYRDGAWREFSRGVEADPPPVFEIGSIGKTFTTTLLAQLVREGMVGLDDPVARFRPQYRFAASVTLRQLASHTAGLPTNAAGTWTLLTRGREFAEAFSPADLERFLCMQPPRPTGRFRYSNVGMSLLGAILAERLGVSYEEAVTKRILVPLGMHDTRIDWRSYPPERLATGHDRRGRPVPPFTWAGMEPAGVWRSTVPDMMRFLAAQLGLADTGWATLARSMVQPVARVSTRGRIGLGWLLEEVPGIGPVAVHQGGTFGQVALALWGLEREVALVILTNRRSPVWHHFTAARNLEGLARRIVCG